jgi:hypothetical protein
MRINVDGKPWLRGYAVFWVVMDENGEPVRWGQAPAFPVGMNHGIFVDAMRSYHQAVHKPVLDATNGRPVEDPICKR